MFHSIADAASGRAPLNTRQCADPKTFVNPDRARYGVDPNGQKFDSYDQLLTQCFGPRPHCQPEDPMKARRPYEAYFLPDAYKGRSDYLLTTIIDAVISGNSFVTGRCLPLLQHDNPDITWSTMSFDNAFVDYEPEQGVPRLLTQRSATFQDHMSRRGIAFVVNHGFANTEGGRLDFFYKLAHMKHVLQETLDHDGLIQLVNCKNDYAGLSNGYADAWRRGDGDGGRACEQERLNFSCIQKAGADEGRGLLKLHETVIGQMARNGVSPDTMIVCPGVKAFAAMEGAALEYYRAGGEAAKNIEGGAKHYDTFRGCTVHTCNAYHLDNAATDVNPFCRDRIIGDFFVLRNWADGRMQAAGDAEKKAISTQVYCCETDRWETFNRLETGQLFYTNSLSTLPDDALNELAEELRKDQADISEKLDADEHGWHPAAGTKITNGKVVLGRVFKGENVHKQYSLLCVRPFRRYRMGSAVFMAAGLDTGFTAHAHEDVQVGDDPISHVHVTHFTGWFSSTIVDTKRVAVVHDVFCMGYSGGEGKTLVTRGDFLHVHPYQYMYENDKQPGSVFVMLAPKNYGAPGGVANRIAAESPIDLSGEGKALPCGMGNHNLPYPNFNMKLWEWHKIAQGMPSGEELVTETAKFAGEPFVNMLCFQTMQKVISQEGMGVYEFGAFVRNDDHFGAEHIGPGSRATRNGGFAAFKTINLDCLKEVC